MKWYLTLDISSQKLAISKGVLVNELTHPDATVIVGTTVLEPNMIDEFRVTIIAMGIGGLG